MKKSNLLFCLVAAVSMLMAACSEKESDLGVVLQDPATLFNGVVDTAYGTACTVFDDSLLTSGQRFALVGCYSNAEFGYSEASIYSAIYSPNGDGVAFDQYYTIDSVVLSLSIEELYPAGTSKGYRNLHFEVAQLGETPMKDTAYYAFSELPLSGVTFFDDVVRVAESDSMVARMRLNNNFVSLIDNHTYATADDFAAAMKGFRVRLVNDGMPIMATVNLAASATRLTVYYTYDNGEGSTPRTHELSIGNSVPHFNNYKNVYSGVLSLFNSSTTDSINGSRYLYLCPMGGTNVRLDFSDFVTQFHAQHPYAVVHYAELLLPVADISPSDRPDLITAFKCYNDGSVVSIPDLVDAHLYNGFDGTYHDDMGCFRLRVTQHLQKLLLSGMDLGTLLVLNGRRSSVAHAVLNGYDRTATNDKGVCIRFVYSE